MKYLGTCLFAFIASTILLVAQQATTPSTDAPASEQRWVTMMQQPGANFYDIQREFNNYWQNRPRQKGDGWKAFKRWEYFWESRILPDGSFPPPSLIWKAVEQKLRDKAAAKQSKKNRLQTPTANFSLMGPASSIPSGGGAGRINCIAFNPTNTNIMWAGSPGGGLWKSTNGGASWTTNTDQFTTLGVSAIAIDPNDVSVMYIGTGDRDANDTYGVGVLRSTNGGSTWNATGLTHTLQNFVTIARILVVPGSGNVVLCASSAGIYKSTDFGSSWSQKISGSFKDMAFMPGNPTVVYAAAGGTIYKSTNTGETWTALSPGFTSSAVNRIAIGVTPHNPRCVYALCSNASGSVFYGLYRSLDTGSTWSLRSSSPNILGGASAGNDTRGQGWYDLAIAVNPNDSNDVFIGGINSWRSTNGGTNWTCKTMWYTGTSLPYIHADQHAMEYKPGTTQLYAGNDGGVFTTTNGGTNWSDLSNGLQIMQFYRISHAATSATFAMGGAQDNGTNRFNNSSWAQVYGGDGMDNAIDFTDANVLYASSQYGNFGRSTNGGGSWTTVTPSGQADNGAWVTPIIIDPTASQTIVTAYSNVFRSTNRGTNWSTIGSGFLTSKATVLAMTPANASHIVVANSSQLYRTTNGGTAWTNIKGTLPSNINRVAIHPTRPDTMWVVMGAWSAGNKVYMTTNGGTTWTNMTGSLPNVPFNCVVLENNTVEGVYVGCDAGIYYRNNAMSDWISFDDGLPNVGVRDLEIHYGSKKLRAGTYGRGLWQGDLYSDAPHADFTASRTTICAGDTITFTDLSTNNPTSRLWQFTGANPAVSTSSSVVVSYPSAGSYPVTLISSNSFGNDTLTRTAYITVNAAPTASFTLSKSAACFGDSIVLAAPVGFSAYRWSNNDTNRIIVFKQPGNYTLSVRVTNANGCSSVSPPQNFSIYSLPIVSISGSSNTICSGDSLTLTASAGYTQYQWSTNATTRSIVVKQSGVYTVTVTDSNGCSASSQSYTVTVNQRPTATITTVGATTFCSGDSLTLSANIGTGYTYSWSNNATTRSIVVREGGSYTVTVSSPEGCTRTSEAVLVNVHPKPDVSITPNGSTSFCEGDSVKLNATAGFTSYLWSNGDTTQSIFVKDARAYSVSVTDANGCKGTSAPLTPIVSPNARPIITVAKGALSFCTGDSVVLDAGAGYASYQWSNGATTRILTLKQATTVHVKTTSLNGCVNYSDTVTTIVQSSLAPVISVVGSTILCAGDSVVLDAGAGYASYLWSNNSTTRTIAVKNSGQYTVNVTSPSGCSGSSQAVAITVYPLPQKPIVTRQSDTLYCSPASTYQWLRNDTLISGAINRWYVPTVAALYCVRITDANGCPSKSDCTFAFEPTALNEEITDYGISVAPNPAEEFIMVRGEFPQPVQLSLYLSDNSGKTVLTIPAQFIEKTLARRIDIHQLAAGVYLLHIDVNGRTIASKKVVKY